MTETIERVLALQEEAEGLRSEGALPEAAARFREAIALLEAEEGPGSPDVANLLNGLSAVEGERGRYEEGLALASRALSILEPIVHLIEGEDGEVLRLASLARLGTFYRELGRYSEAEPILKRALSLSEATFGEEHAQTADARGNLAVLYKYTANFDEAEALYRRALAVTEGAYTRSGGEERAMALATLYHNFGGLFHAKGEYERGEPYARKAYELRRSALGEEHPVTLADGAALAGILDGLERYEESEGLYLRALAGFEARYGPVHYEIAVNLNNLGMVRRATGRLAEAEEMLRRALAVKERLFSAEHPDVAISAGNLAALLRDLGRLEEAEELARRAVTICEARLSAEHPNALACRELLEEIVAARK
jgi:tetratricopeptide (TPR) repeat protein